MQLCRTVPSCYKTNIPTTYRNMFKISSKTLGKGVNLVNVENIRMATYDVVIYLVLMWNEIRKLTYLEPVTSVP